jgi:hypothetical protein
MQSERKLWEILVPTTMDRTRKDGSIKKAAPIRIKYHKQWDEKVKAIAGGLTILGVARGHWIDDLFAEEFVERMIPVRISCTADEIAEIAEITAEHYNQRAVMYYKLSDEVYIRRSDPSPA